MSGIILTRGAMAAGVHALLHAAGTADRDLGQRIACAGLKMLHAILCSAEDLGEAETEAPGWETEEEAEPETTTDAEALSWSDEDIAAQDAPAPAAFEAADAARPAAEQAPPVPPPEAVVLDRVAPHSRLTPERRALFLTLWGTDLSVRQVMDRLNQLPGEPYTAPQAMYRVAKTCGLPTVRAETQVAPPAKPAPLPASAPAAPRIPATFPPAHFRPPVAVPASPAFEASADDRREAEALVREKPGVWHGRKLAEEYGWPIEYAATFVAAVRAGNAAP